MQTNTKHRVIDSRIKARRDIRNSIKSYFGAAIYRVRFGL